MAKKREEEIRVALEDLTHRALVDIITELGFGFYNIDYNGEDESDFNKAEKNFVKDIARVLMRHVS